MELRNAVSTISAVVLAVKYVNRGLARTLKPTKGYQTIPAEIPGVAHCRRAACGKGPVGMQLYTAVTLK